MAILSPPTGRHGIALLPVGYADGLNRLLSNRGHVLVRGQEAPIAGRVSMDQTMVDVTGIPGVAIGDEVVLLGSQGGQSIDAWDLADLTETIPWEVLCAIGARVPRVMVASMVRPGFEKTSLELPQSSRAIRIPLPLKHVEARGIPHLARSRTSCTRSPPRAACVAFSTESRMKFVNATKVHRKSEMWGTRGWWKGKK